MMRKSFSPLVWPSQSLALAVLWPMLALVGQTQAQLPVGENGKFYSKQTHFNLPIHIEDKYRDSIREVWLCVKTPGGEWLRSQTAQPGQESFTYHAPCDGEYWFTLVMLDSQWTTMPDDAAQAAPGKIMKVVVDTQAPTFDLRTMKGANGGLRLRCTVNDANPDPKGIKITWESKDHRARLLEPIPGQPEVFVLPGPEIFTAPVQVVVTDLAGNTRAQDVNLQEVPASLEACQMKPAMAPQEATAPPGKDTPEVVEMNRQGVKQAQVNLPQTAAGGPAPVRMAEQKLPVSSLQLANQLLINTTRAWLEYFIDQVGPSGVSKVEVWVTSDQGQSWQRLSEDKDHRNPTEIDLPGDGLYGVRVVVTDGNGFGGRPLVAGDQPDCWIEVDTVAPLVQLREIEPIAHGSTVDIRWRASDKNLGTEPVSLFFAARKDGPWQALALHQKNDGLYRWTLPRDMGDQFIIRAEVTDLAGNVGRAESATAIVLDMTEPRARVVRVTAVRAAPVPGDAAGPVVTDVGRPLVRDPVEPDDALALWMPDPPRDGDAVYCCGMRVGTFRGDRARGQWHIDLVGTKDLPPKLAEWARPR
jgi:hypothetical protein